MKSINRNKIKSNSKQYTYDDWLEGRITIGGLQSFDSSENSEAFKKKIKTVNWNTIDKEQLKLIQRDQEKIFWSEVEYYLKLLKEGFLKLLSKSEEKEILIEKTFEDLRILFDRDLKSDVLSLTYINKNYSYREVQKIKTFKTEHIERGNRNYDFIQSKKQVDKSFRNPPFEIEAEVLYKFYKFIQEEYTIAKVKLHLNEIALYHFYNEIDITPTNCNTFASMYGHSSGRKLYQHYNSYKSKLNRIALESSPKKTKSKIDLFYKVKDLLLNENLSTIKIDEDIKLLHMKYLEEQGED